MLLFLVLYTGILQFNDKCKHLIILSDFTFPIMDWKYWTGNNGSIENEFLDILRDHLVLENMSESTRMKALNQPHILDVVIGNEDIISNIQYLSQLGNSDH